MFTTRTASVLFCAVLTMGMDQSPTTGGLTAGLGALPPQHQRTREEEAIRSSPALNRYVRSFFRVGFPSQMATLGEITSEMDSEQPGGPYTAEINVNMGFQENTIFQKIDIVYKPQSMPGPEKFVLKFVAGDTLLDGKLDGELDVEQETPALPAALPFQIGGDMDMSKTDGQVIKEALQQKFGESEYKTLARHSPIWAGIGRAPTSYIVKTRSGKHAAEVGISYGTSPIGPRHVSIKDLSNLSPEQLDERAKQMNNMRW